MFRDVYSSELEYLHQLADDFAQKHPNVASLLGRDASPASARLFQSAAFLFARLRQRLDDDAPEIIHPVIESLFPALLRPTPSATVLELRPQPAMKEPLLVKAGSPFGGRADEEPPCIFRSSIDVTVVPWRITRVDVAQDRRELRLEVALFEGAKPPMLTPGTPLRLFLSGPTSTGLDLRSALLRSTRDVVARAPDTTSHGVPLVDGRARLRDVRALPTDDAGAPAFAALRAYFTWPAHFAFVEIPNIDRALSVATASGRFEVVIYLNEELPRSMRPGVDSIRLHCVPALNVHALVEPIHVPVQSRRCVLRLPRGEMQVHSIDGVSVVGRDLSARAATAFAQFFPPVVDRDGAEPLFFSVERRPSTVNADPIVSLLFDGPGLERARDADVLLQVTDGARAERLRLGDVRVPVAGSPSLVTFGNITPITRSVAPALEGDRMWRWLQALKGTLPQLAQRKQLAACLALANQPAWAQWPDAKPGSHALEAIVDVRALHARSATGNASMSLSVRIDPEAFTGLGDVDLFGELLADLFASTLREHESIALDVCDATGSPLFRYPAAFGTREGL